MFAHQERLALLLLAGVAVAVIVSHLALSCVGNQPFAHPFTNESPDGELVVIEGMVDHAELTKSSGHVLLLIRNTTIFIPADVAAGQSFGNGQYVSVYGIVQTYNGKKEIAVSSPDDITRIQPG